MFWKMQFEINMKKQKETKLDYLINVKTGDYFVEGNIKIVQQGHHLWKEQKKKKR